MKGVEYNEGDPYEDLFQREYYDNSLVDFEDKESSLDNEEVYDTNTNDMNNQYLGIVISISRNDTTQEVTILGRNMNSDGSLIGTKITNPILDPKVYAVGFPDGSRYDMATNVIVENLFDSALEDGDIHTYIDSIVDIRST